MEHTERADEAIDVIAAGGGPAGLMTAALLGMAGVRAELCERGSEPTRQSRGTAMHPRTLEVLAGQVEHARHHWHQEPGHADVVPLGGSAARVYGTHAGDSQLAAGQARRQKAPFSPAGPSATVTGIGGIGSGAHSPSWLAGRATPGYGTPPAWPGTGRHAHHPPRTRMQRTASRSSRP